MEGDDSFSGVGKLFALFWLGFSWVMGGFVHGVSSIGGAMVAMPMMTFTTAPRDAILIACMAFGIIPLALSLLYRRHILRRELLWLALGALPGVPAGVALLTVLSGPVLLFGVGALLVAFVLWQTFSHRVQSVLPFHPLVAVLVGAAGAFITACTSMGGPIFAVYAAFRGWKKEEALATTSMNFNVVNASIILLQGQAGLYSDFVLHAVAVSLPCAILGVLISLPVVRVMPQETFRKVLLAMIFASGLVLVVRALA